MVDTPSRSAAALKPLNAPRADETPEPSLIEQVSGWLKATFGQRTPTSIKDALEEAIDGVLEAHDDHSRSLGTQETTLLRNVLTFGDLTVHEIMTPRSDITAVPVDISLEGLKQHMLTERHTRIPVFRDTLDQVEGFLHMKDLFPMVAGDEPYAITRVMRPMLFVPPSMKIVDLLLKMRRQKSHMAIVVDEYGGTDGLITLEDLFEEIVGDIQDEHDEEEGKRELVRLSDHAIEADARVRIDRLQRELGLDLYGDGEGEEQYDTLGGLIFFELGRVPARGEVIAHPSGVQFEILESDPRRIRRVRIIQGQRETVA